MRSLVNDRSAVVKKPDKGWCVVVWDREDYIAEAEKQIRDIIVYKDVNFKEKLSQDLSEFSNISYLKILRIYKESHKKELKYFAIDLKRLPILVNCIPCLRFTNAYLRFQVGQ